MGQEDS
jgi:putative glutathione S-transferase